MAINFVFSSSLLMLALVSSACAEFWENPSVPLHAATHRGDLAGEIVLELDAASLPNNLAASPALEARVFGIEMVYIPEGPFSVGDRDTGGTRLQLVDGMGHF